MVSPQKSVPLCRRYLAQKQAVAERNACTRKKITGEGRLRKPHRREWDGFLKHLIPNQAWRELRGLVKKGMDPRGPRIADGKSRFAFG